MTTRTLLLPWSIYKEFRALWLAWCVCVLVLIVPTLLQAPRYVRGLQVIAYILGAAALGALSIGHEYMDRTLHLLLCLPVRRRRLLLLKLGALAPLLAALGVVAYTDLFHEMPADRQFERLAASLLPLLGGLFIAPWLTMACRSPLAGIALTVAIPFPLVMVGRAIAVRIGAREDEFMMAFLWWGASGLCAIGAIATRRMFMRLEAIDGCVEDLPLPQLPHLRRARASNGAGAAVAALTRRHPIWQLVTKELRVQQPLLFMTGLYLFGWLAVTVRASNAPLDLNAALSAFYALLLAVLAGSLGSAEERQLGTIDWQVLQPIAMWRQWAVKMAVVLGLPMLLGIGLPMLLAHVAPAAGGRPVVGQPLAMNLLLLTAGSLYVSSLCGSGAWALVTSLAVTFGVIFFQNVVLGVDAAWLFSGPAPSAATLHGSQVVHGLDLLLIAGLIGVLARFALSNHRTAERSAWRVCRQVAVLTVFATLRVVILSDAAALSQRW